MRRIPPPFIATIHHSACILNEVVYILSEIVVNSTPHSKKASALRISTHQPKKGRKREANTHTHTRKTENFSHSEFLICNGIAWEYLYVVEIYSKFVMVRAFLFRTVCTKKWKRNGNERNGVDRMVNKLKMGFHKFTHTHTHKSENCTRSFISYEYKNSISDSVKHSISKQVGSSISHWTIYVIKLHDKLWTALRISVAIWMFISISYVMRICESCWMSPAATENGKAAKVYGRCKWQLNSKKLYLHVLLGVIEIIAIEESFLRSKKSPSWIPFEPHMESMRNSWNYAHKFSSSLTHTHTNTNTFPRSVQTVAKLKTKLLKNWWNKTQKNE